VQLADLLSHILYGAYRHGLTIAQCYPSPSGPQLRSITTAVQLKKPLPHSKGNNKSRRWIAQTRCNRNHLRYSLKRAVTARRSLMPATEPLILSQITTLRYPLWILIFLQTRFCLTLHIYDDRCKCN